MVAATPGPAAFHDVACAGADVDGLLFYYSQDGGKTVNVSFGSFPDDCAAEIFAADLAGDTVRLRRPAPE